MKYFITFLLSALSICSEAQKTDFDSLYRRVDEEIAHAPAYVQAKEQHISQMKSQLASSRNAQERYELAYALYREYQAYENDQAIDYLKDALAIAKSMNWQEQQAQCNIDLANQYMCTGYYNEARDYMDEVERQGLDGHLLAQYYSRWTHLYQYMGNNSREDKMKAHYHKVATLYRDSLYQCLDTQSLDYLWERSMQLCAEDKYDSVKVISDNWIQRVKPGTHDYAIMAYFRSESYRGQNDLEQRKRWLVESAISDIQASVRDQTSLWSLADILSQEGDVERSYRFIDYSWRCAQQFNTRVLSWLVSPVLSSINDNYNKQLRTANRRFVWLTVIVGLLAIGLAVAYLFVRRRERQLNIARQELDATNRQLAEINAQLTTSNAQLGEANRVKDEYIGQFFSICSQYIDKLDNYRIKINRKLKAGQTQELLKMTSSEQLREDELEELFANFDAVFLQLFPHFVEGFNALLTPENRIVLDDERHLTTQLRIFALIRLGIEESSKIAEFLHYSPNSIYNYRARIKNKALCDRNDFERLVKTIM